MANSSEAASMTSNARGAASPVATGSQMLPDEIASHLISKYTKGIMRVALEQLAVGASARSISPKYVHHFRNAIVNENGFAPCCPAIERC